MKNKMVFVISFIGVLSGIAAAVELKVELPGSSERTDTDIAAGRRTRI